MRTAIVSDLHLGSGHGEDVLRDPAIRRVAARGDRAAPTASSCSATCSSCASCRWRRRSSAARPFFEELGEAMAGREVVARPRQPRPPPRRAAARRARARRRPAARARAPPRPRRRPDRAGSPAGSATAELRIAYPGIWLRDDVYATHGHYMDCHMSLPRAECLAAAAADARLRPAARPGRRRPTTSGSCARSTASPSALAQARPRAGRRRRRPSERAWQLLSGSDRAAAAGAPPRAARRRRRGRRPGGDLGAQPPAARRLRRRPLRRGDLPQRRRRRDRAGARASASTPPT